MSHQTGKPENHRLKFAFTRGYAIVPRRASYFISNYLRIIATSAEVTPNGRLVRESPQNPLNSGLGTIIICLELWVYVAIFGSSSVVATHDADCRYQISLRMLTACLTIGGQVWEVRLRASDGTPVSWNVATTPTKINMEPKNYPCAKENHLPNLHYCVPS